METTRHYTATVYVVSDGAVPLHEHDGLDMWLPPGGHVDRDQLPHEAALREVREETGIDADLVAERDDITSPTTESLPKPAHLRLADVNVHDDFVGHQHVDMVYYARADTREIDPEEGEQPASAWRWFDREDLDATDDLDADVAEIARRAIDAVSE